MEISHYYAIYHGNRVENYCKNVIIIQKTSLAAKIITCSLWRSNLVHECVRRDSLKSIAILICRLLKIPHYMQYT